MSASVFYVVAIYTLSVSVLYVALALLPERTSLLLLDLGPEGCGSRPCHGKVLCWTMPCPTVPPLCLRTQ